MSQAMRRRLDSNFQRQLIQYAKPLALKKDLPLVHATHAWTINDILSADTIEIRDCVVFGRKLAYFFALRPSYVKKAGEETHRLSLAPAVLILRPEAVPTPAHVYPFDTGGAISGAFGDQADPLIPLDDYELESTHSAARGMVEWAFGDAQRYYEGRLRNDILSNVPESHCVVTGYVDIARLGVDGNSDHDKRASTVEIASFHNVALKDNVLLAILPGNLLEKNPTVRSTLRRLGASVRPYAWQPNRRQIEFQPDIMRVARKWYIQQGWNL